MHSWYHVCVTDSCTETTQCAMETGKEDLWSLRGASYNAHVGLTRERKVYILHGKLHIRGRRRLIGRLSGSLRKPEKCWKMALQGGSGRDVLSYVPGRLQPKEWRTEARPTEHGDIPRITSKKRVPRAEMHKGSRKNHSELGGNRSTRNIANERKAELPRATQGGRPVREPIEAGRVPWNTA